jgi:soluble lytic murein transglycosylase-like protein
MRILLLTFALCCGPALSQTHRSVDTDCPGSPVAGLQAGCMPVWRINDLPRAESEAARRLLAHGNLLNFSGPILAAAKANDIDAALISAIIYVESSFNPSAVSRGGAVGLMQLTPEIARRYNVRNSHDPEQNIHGGTRHLRDLMRQFNNNMNLVIAAYNAGGQAVMKYGNAIPPYRETQAYVPKVLEIYNLYSIGGTAARAQEGLRLFSTPPKHDAQSRMYRVSPAKPT